MPVRVEKEGPVTTVILHRPEVRNAVDRAHADALAEAFRAFDADDARARRRCSSGEGGNFCAGADLKAIAAGRAATASSRTATGRWARRACCCASR